jgi:hypothetical protein
MNPPIQKLGLDGLRPAFSILSATRVLTASDSCVRGPNTW